MLSLVIHKSLTLNSTISTRSVNSMGCLFDFVSVTRAGCCSGVMCQPNLPRVVLQLNGLCSHSRESLSRVVYAVGSTVFYQLEESQTERQVLVENKQEARLIF